LTGKDTINLQKLGVVLHTVFIGGPTLPPRRPEVSRRSTMTENSRWPANAPLNSSRVIPADKKELDDLRKKLLAGDGSTISLHGNVPLSKDRERRESTTSVRSSAPSSTGVNVPPMTDKSPPESVTSGAEASGSAFAKRRHRIQLSSDGKAPPLVGSIRTNVTGLLEAPSTLRPVQEDSATPSGRSSPVSQAGTLRRDRGTGLSAMSHLTAMGEYISLLDQ
jgi:phosphoinositide-3-kinase, regulatory subunit 4